jgi:aspartyl-tRNA(Asn)/glutamyl-tRNA(Gln) amidotransferase subunit B
MEKGHMRCDANISLHDGTKMSPIIELKNINSFKFVEKALALVETHLNSTHDSWPDKLTKETWGYDSVLNKVYLQRSKEGATDYRYFPCPDLPPFDSSVFDLEALKSDLGQTADDKKSQYELTGLSAQEAHILATNQTKEGLYLEIAKHFENKEAIAKFVVHSTLDFDENDLNNASAYANLIEKLNGEEISKKMAADISAKIHETGLDFNQAFALVSSTSNVGETELKNIIAKVVETNEKELLRFQSGEKQLFGFFMGQVLKETKGKGDPQTISKILREML